MEMSDKLTELEVAMLKHLEFIVRYDHRSVSFLDFMHFEVEGKEFSMTHGTFRNKVMKLKERGIVELENNSGVAFYTIKGVHFGKTAMCSMTPNHIGVLLQHVKRVPNIKKHPLYKLIKHHPFDKTAVHDVHLKFIAAGLWSILYSSNNNNTSNKVDPYSYDIRLEKRVINDLEIQIAVHHTDTVTVVIGCSYASIIVDEYGVIRLSEALATVEEKLSVLVEQGIGGVGSGVDIPNHMSWIVTRWDFGVDGLITYTGDHFFFSWGSSQNVLIVIYIKKWSQNDYRIRVECREPLGKALKERIVRRKGS